MCEWETHLKSDIDTFIKIYLVWLRLKYNYILIENIGKIIKKRITREHSHGEAVPKDKGKNFVIFVNKKTKLYNLPF